MFIAMLVALQGKTPAFLHHNALHFEALALVQHMEGTPGAIFTILRHSLVLDMGRPESAVDGLDLAYYKPAILKL